MPPTVPPFQHLPQQPQHLTQQQQNQPFYPALYLYPLNDSFVPKQISLAPQNGRVKIGRQTNAKTVPGERNGYFDSKVLSRQHAEVWEEDGHIYIKDVKSSNGTFINGERLSAEGAESQPFELKTDDTVEFGIDIVGEDNKTIIHHKVAAKVYCILTPEDLANLPMHHQAANRRAMGPQMQSNAAQNGALGGMGGAPRQGKSGLTFDHILNRLQTELAKSRETGNELSSLTNAMSDIQETLGGGLPPNLPSFPAVLPPVRLSQNDEPARQPSPPTAPDSSAINSIQTQIHDTQSTLQQYSDKIRSLESYVNEQETIKREVTQLREQMEERKREVELLLMKRQREDDSNSHFSRRRDVLMAMEDDDDDARSVATAVPDRDDDEENEERRRRREEVARPRTPEPTGHLSDEEYEEERRVEAAAQSQSLSFASDTTLTNSLTVPPTSLSSAANGHSSPSHTDLSTIYSQNALLATRLETLTAQLDSAMELSRSLQNQAMMAQETIASLEAKVVNLETFVHERKEKVAVAGSLSTTLDSPPSHAQDDSDSPSVTLVDETDAELGVSKIVWEEWRDRVEGSWKAERETWASERERLGEAVKEWERRTTELERKEDERSQREEAAALAASRKDEGGFDSSDEGSDKYPLDDRLPSMINGFSPKKGGRRRKSHGANGHALPNGVAVLPSPVSSPTSSAAYYPHIRRPTTPSSEELPSGSSSYPSHSLVNGKLPLSPPNTSPRSRPESLAAPMNEDEESTPAELPKVEGGQLGLTNGHPIGPNGSVPNGMQGQIQYLDGAALFAEQSGVGQNSLSVKQHISAMPLPFLGVGVAGAVFAMAAVVVLYRDGLNKL